MSRTINKPNRMDPAALAAGMESRTTEANGVVENQSASEPLAATVALPVHFCHGGFATDCIEFRMTSRQAAAAKVLWSSLSTQGARYTGGGGNHPDGKVVDCANHALRYILDRVADGIEAEGRDLLRDFALVFR